MTRAEALGAIELTASVLLATPVASGGAASVRTRSPTHIRVAVLTALLMMGIYAVFALGLNVQWGYTGLFNIGIAGFFAIVLSPLVKRVQRHVGDRRTLATGIVDWAFPLYLTNISTLRSTATWLSKLTPRS